MILPILLTVICLVLVVKDNNQARMPIPKAFNFSGEYSYDGENWYLYNEESDISAFDGDIVVRGHLDFNVEEGVMINFFCNHIGVSIYINGERMYIDTPAEIRNYGIDLMASMCGKRWEQMRCPGITTEDEIEFRFINYHKHGNKNAYKEALDSLLITPPDNSILEIYLKPYIQPLEFLGFTLLIVAIMLLGAFFSAIVFRSSIAKRLFKIGITTLFVGGYIIFDVIMVYIMDELLVIKTYGRQLCFMVAVYFIGMMVCDAIKEKYKKVAEIIIGISGIINLLIIVFVSVGKILLYDTQFFWKIVQCMISTVLIVLCILELKKEKSDRIELITYISINIAILLDMADVGYHMYYSGFCFKVMYVVMLIIFLFRGIKQVVLDYQASIKNKKLKEELEQSRIAIMFSQIQPHFLYNSLTSVMDLCDSNPKKAKAAIADFADYLRGNLDSLKTERMISFGTELAHIEKYLRLEKLRFQEKLEVIYDIQFQDFMLPALSVQPLIENAVKHGVGKKIGGGTVKIHTSETESNYMICITDDGIGFIEGEYVDQDSTHVGIENTKKRLDMMMNARLEIESEKGKGTTARILIPKRRD